MSVSPSIVHLSPGLSGANQRLNNSLCKTKGHVPHLCLLGTQKLSFALSDFISGCVLPERKLHISGNQNFGSIKAGAQTLLFKMTRHFFFPGSV